MKRLFHLKRLLHIVHIGLRYRLDDIIITHLELHSLRFLLVLNPYHWLSRKRIPDPVRLRLAIIALGPLFIKLGQVLSTRQDLLSEAFAEELSKLQDKLPPFSGQLAKKMVEQEFNKPIHALFKHFDTEALGSASIAQVHAATLLDGRSVVVKILRPGIHKKIKVDLSLMHSLAKFFQKHSRSQAHVRATDIVNEFERLLYDELDLLREAANASRFRYYLHDRTDVKVPTIVWPYCRKSIMVSEHMIGIPIFHLKLLREKGVDLPALASTCLHLFLTQAFRNNFFHADLHPGNILINTDTPNKPVVILLDFGIVSSLNERDKFYIQECFLAIFKRDYWRLTDLHIEAGWIPKTTSREQFSGAIATACEPLLERQGTEASFAQLIGRLLNVSNQFQLDIQPQLLLLQKTFFNVEGLMRTLDPDTDIWKIIPVLKKFLREDYSVKKIMEQVGNMIPLIVRRFVMLPPKWPEYMDPNAQKSEPKPSQAKSRLGYFLLGSVSTVIFAGILIYLF